MPARLRGSDVTVTAVPSSTQETSPGHSVSGVLSSAGASALFSVIFFLAAALEPLDAFQMLAWRIVAMLIVVALVFTALRLWSDVRNILSRLRQRPVLVAVVVLDGALFALQQWLFGWAPQAGRGLEAALGYLLLPLVMVVLGVLLHRERLSALRITSVIAAAAGVTAAIFIAGGLTWPTLVVALGFPVYFVIRRHTRLDSGGALLLELVVMLPFSAWMLSQSATWKPLLDTPKLAWTLALFGLVSGIAFTLFFRASRLLPFGLFGLLSYLEPVLLIVVAVTLLDENLAPADALVYGPIALALGLLAIESTRRSPAPGQSRAVGGRAVDTGRASAPTVAATPPATTAGK
jgi:chloramphenicol-sensitive protein RarD